MKDYMLPPRIIYNKTRKTF